VIWPDASLIACSILLYCRRIACVDIAVFIAFIISVMDNRESYKLESFLRKPFGLGTRMMSAMRGSCSIGLYAFLVLAGWLLGKPNAQAQSLANCPGVIISHIPAPSQVLGSAVNPV